MVNVKKRRCPVCVVDGADKVYNQPLLRSYIRPKSKKSIVFSGYYYCPKCKSMYREDDSRLIEE